MGYGVIVQCARVDRLADTSTTTGSTQTTCLRCRQRVWISPPVEALARTEVIKPLCDVCQPAIPVELGNIHGDDALGT